jgi:beta-RFAP synthase
MKPIDSSTRLAEVDSACRVDVRAPGRLHLGFLDPAGTLGRRFGSLGLVVDRFETFVQLGASADNAVSASSSAARREVDRAAAHLAALQRLTGREAPLHLHLQQVLPAHAGFGSGTQLALAVGRAFAAWHHLDLPLTTLAQWLGRGLRSGIGIGGFERGGLLVDGGPGADGQAAPVLCRAALPEAWRVVVVMDASRQGLSGEDERAALAGLPPMPRAVAADICHQVLMRVLPGAACADFAPFAEGITQIQAQLGSHFAAAQSGDAYTSAAVGRLIRWIGHASRDGEGSGAAVGQSSWGPTGFAILPDQAQADRLVAAARSAGQVSSELQIHVVAARNHGATLVEHRQLDAAATAAT